MRKREKERKKERESEREREREKVALKGESSSWFGKYVWQKFVFSASDR